MCTLMTICISEAVGGQAPTVMTMEKNLNERKRGIRDVCKEDGRGFDTIVMLPLCHSAALSLYYKSLTVALSL